MTIIEKIQKLMEKRGVSRYKLAKETGVPYTTLIKILDGTTSNPQIESLSHISDYFKVSVDYLTNKSASSLIENRLEEIGKTLEEVSQNTGVPLKWLQNLDSFTPGEADDIIENRALNWNDTIGDYRIYRSYTWITKIAEEIGLPGSQLRAALARQEIPVYDGPPIDITPEEAFKDSFEETPAKKLIALDPEYLRRIPLVGRAAAGDPMTAIENPGEYIVIDTRINKVNGNNIDEFYALEVVGQSMEPTLFDGEIVLIRKQEVIELGEIGVFRCNGDEATIKRFARESGKIYLKPDNMQYPVQVYTDEGQCICVGKVMESIRRAIK